MPAEIKIGKHVCERYIERFNPNLSAVNNKQEQLQKAALALRAILADGVYVSDSNRGILFESKSFHASYIIRNNCLRTIWQTSQKIKAREQKPRATNEG